MNAKPHQPPRARARQGAARVIAETPAAPPRVEAPSEGESVQEAEGEVGIADWIEAETGEPAEGQSPLHLEEP